MWSSQQERQKAADFSTAFYDIWWVVRESLEPLTCKGSRMPQNEAFQLKRECFPERPLLALRCLSFAALTNLPPPSRTPARELPFHQADRLASGRFPPHPGALRQAGF